MSKHDEDKEEIEQISFEEGRKFLAAFHGVPEEKITPKMVQEESKTIELLQAAEEYGFMLRMDRDSSDN